MVAVAVVAPNVVKNMPAGGRDAAHVEAASPVYISATQPPLLLPRTPFPSKIPNKVRPPTLCFTSRSDP